MSATGSGRFSARLGRLALVAVPFLWLVAFFLVPFAIVLRISLSESAIAIPPYEPAFDLSAGWEAIREQARQLDLDKYRFLAADPLYIESYLSSLRIAAISTVLTLLAGYPLAYGMARAPRGLHGWASWRATVSSTRRSSPSG
jgi:putrescine transport system permease protein